jgi:antagonist of KipI
MYMVIRKAGLYTSVRGAGRSGGQDRGFPPGGAADTVSFRQANRLVGNPEDATVLECTLLGPEVIFNAPGMIAITGADMQPLLNGFPVPLYRALRVGTGWKLSFGQAGNGCRTYLAVKGGLGKENGKRLREGDLLPLTEQKAGYTELPFYAVPEEERICGKKGTPILLRAVRGPQAEAFTDAGYQKFFAAEYTVTEESSRMGIRLSGEKIELKSGADIISDGIPTGAVQISSAGQPMVMMNDHQTVGGYAKIAVTVSYDLPLLAEARPGDRVRFREVSVEEAQAPYRKAAG